MDDSTLIVHFKLLCVPSDQFMARREAYTRIKTAFEENEIRLALRRVIVEAISPALAAKATEDILKIEAENWQQFGVNRA